MRAFTEYCCGRLPLTLTADVFAAFKALEYINIINTNSIILLIRGEDVEPPNLSFRGLDSTAARHGVRDHLPAGSTSYCMGDNVVTFSQELASLLGWHRHIV